MAKDQSKKMKQPKPGAPDHSKYYEDALKGKFAPVKEDNPQCGYYRIKLGGKLIPITFFSDDVDGEDITCTTVENCKAAHRVEDPDRVFEYWAKAAKNPVFKHDWWTAHDTGNWPDNPKDEKEDELRANLPSDPGEANRIEALAKIDFAKEWLKKHPKIDSEGDANAARSLENQLLALRNEANPLHKAEKQPHLDAGRAVDDKYRYREDLTDAADDIKRLREAFQREQDRKKKAEADAAAAAAAKVREEAALKAMAEADDPTEVVLPPAPVSPVTFEKTVAKGGYGRGATVSRTYRGEIVNLTTALLHFQNNARVREALDAAIKAEVRTNKEHSSIPGVLVWNDLDELISDGTKGSAAPEAAAIAA